MNTDSSDDILNKNSAKMGKPPTVAGVFSGIGGLELGFHRSGYQTELLCEIDPGAIAVLKRRFDAAIHPDIRTLRSFPEVDVVCGGFPCQDLSQAGRTAGIQGANSSLVGEVFKRLTNRRGGPRWLVLENVPFMLQLQRGRAMRFVVDHLEDLGFTWAYRVVDAQAFGLPQRRQRVILIASRTEDPRLAVFGESAAERAKTPTPNVMRGFYWTEGLRGLGWALDSVPTLKGGSTIGIPSPPAIWDPLDGSISTPDLRDAERLQGFDADWTLPASDALRVRSSHRWKLVGNAVSVSVSEWVATRLLRPDGVMPSDIALPMKAAWPKAAWGHKGKAYGVDCTKWPVSNTPEHLREFLHYERTPLSHRAASGFLSRAELSSLKFEPNFIRDVRTHVKKMARLVA